MTFLVFWPILSIELFCLKSLHNILFAKLFTGRFVNKDHLRARMFGHTLHGLLLKDFNQEFQDLSGGSVGFLRHFSYRVNPTLGDVLPHHGYTLSP